MRRSILIPLLGWVGAELTNAANAQDISPPAPPPAAVIKVAQAMNAAQRGELMQYLFGKDVINQPVALPEEPKPAPTAKPSSKEPAKEEEFYPIELPLLLEKKTLGMMNAKVSMASDVRVKTADFLRLLKPAVSEAFYSTIEARAGGQEYADLKALAANDFSLSYDAENLQIVCSTPVNNRQLEALDATDIETRNLSSLITPALIAAGADIFATQRATHDEGYGKPPETDPLAASANAFLRLGTTTPLYLASQADFLEEDGWARTQSTLFYDSQESAVRYALGDLTFETIGFQQQFLVGGLSVERQYNEIQPFRSIFPNGRSELVLEEPSEVIVELNGAEVRRFSLEAGRYDIRDLPLVSGLNNVVLRVRSPSGREQLVDYDFVADNRLLAEGISNFSAGMGKLRTIVDREVKYDGDNVTSAHYEYGVTSSFTAGVYSQTSQNETLVGARATVGVPIGLLSADTAYNTGEMHDGAAARIGYTWWDDAATDKDEFLSKDEIDLVLDVIREGFSPFATTATLYDYNWQLEARYRATMPENIAITLSSLTQNKRNTSVNRQVYGAGLSRYFADAGVFASLSATLEENMRGKLREGSLLFSLSIPIGSESTARVSADTRSNRLITEYDRRLSDGTDEYGYRVSANRSDDERGVTGEFNYTGNRFGVRADHAYVQSLTGGGISKVSSVTANAGLAFADGHFAFGREVTPGFVIVDKHRTLADSEVDLKRGGTGTVQAYTDIFGAAVVPVESAYIPRSYEYEVSDLPPGYSLDSARIDVQPGAFSGYYHRIGSDASVTVMGRVQGADGEPVSLLSGRLEPTQEGDTRTAIAFFTNRTGRLIAEGASTGTYRVMLGGGAAPVGQITIPEDTVGMYDIGILSLPAGEP